MEAQYRSSVRAEVYFFLFSVGATFDRKSMSFTLAALSLLRYNFTLSWSIASFHYARVHVSYEIRFPEKRG